MYILNLIQKLDATKNNVCSLKYGFDSQIAKQQKEAVKQIRKRDRLLKRFRELFNFAAPLKIDTKDGQEKLDLFYLKKFLGVPQLTTLESFLLKNYSNKHARLIKKLLKF